MVAEVDSSLALFIFLIEQGLLQCYMFNVLSNERKMETKTFKNPIIVTTS